MKISPRLKRRVKRALLISIILFSLLFISLAYFFIVNEAPILQGEVEYHIAYKNDQNLDIYLPIVDKHEKRPVIIYFHGGAWISGRKEAINVNRYNDAINQLRRSGYAIITPEYTLADENTSPFPDCLLDANDALAWVVDHAEKYNLDINNVGIFGESAGAHIAMMTAFDNQSTFNLPKPKPKIKYVIDIYGPVEMESLYYSQTYDSIKTLLNKVPEPIANNLDFTLDIFGFDPKADTVRTKEFMQRYSPIRYLHDSIPPLLIIHGTIDKIVPLDQSLQLKKSLDSLQLQNEYHELSDMGHAFRNATDAQKDSTQKWIVDFVKRNYREN